MNKQFDLELLLARADDHRPSLAGGIPFGAAASAPKPSRILPVNLRFDSADPNDLRIQRWGMIAPLGPAGDRLLALVEPLSQHRREQQGVDVRIYRVPPGMDAVAAAAWKDKVYCDEKVPVADRPRYLLLLGDLDLVSLELQQSIATDTYVGRLAFRDDAGYAAYVQKLLRAERAAAADDARLHFFTVRDNTAATSISQQSLVTPSLERCRSEQGRGNLPVKTIAQIPYNPAASATAFLEQAAASEPAIFFTVSHGLGPSRVGWKSVDEQRALQGSMVLGTRPGERLTAEDVKKRPFMPSGVWFFMACYGGAVPSASVYFPWLSRLKDVGLFPGRVEAVLEGLPKQGERPFVSALPLAALANEAGPLAVIAHADLAWTYSFQDMDGDPCDRPSRFEGVFRSLAEAARVGPAHHELIETMVQKGEELLAIPEDAPGAPSDAAKIIRRANLWMLRHDLGGYLILGDPAARLPLSRRPDAAFVIPDYASARKVVPARDPAEESPAEESPAAGAPEAASFTLPDESRRAPASPAETAKRVRVVLEVLKERAFPDVIAEQYGVSRDDLDRWVDAYKEAGRKALGTL